MSPARHCATPLPVSNMWSYDVVYHGVDKADEGSSHPSKHGGSPPSSYSVECQALLVAVGMSQHGGSCAASVRHHRLAGKCILHFASAIFMTAEADRRPHGLIELVLVRTPSSF